MGYLSCVTVHRCESSRKTCSAFRPEAVAKEPTLIIGRLAPAEINRSRSPQNSARESVSTQVLLGRDEAYRYPGIVCQ